MGYLCILWHFHQPFYSDIEENINETSIIVFRTLQNYYPMAVLLKNFENIKINFNITPSLLKQIKFIAENKINDVFFNIFDYDLSEEKLINFYNEFPGVYAHSNKILSLLKEKIELKDYSEKDIFDFKFLLHLISFNPLIYDDEIKYFIEKMRNFDINDVGILINKEKNIFKNIIPLYKKLQEENKIEISTTPFYHPILPLIYDTEIMKKTKTNFPAPEQRFNYPEDAKKQIKNGINFYKEVFGKEPKGIWPSEGALSNEVLDLFIEENIDWTATDENLLFESLNNIEKKDIYKVYKYKNNLFIFFRDHFLSDLIGFSYQNMDEEEAAIDLIKKIEKILDENSEGIITIILDGENPWDYYKERGIKFLKKFYELLEENKKIKTLTFSEAIKITKNYGVIENIFPGSWMGPNFDNWIGKETANKAWEILKKTREKIDDLKEVDKIVEEIILNCEGSDWFWWYSIETDKNIKMKFDRYFKNNLRKVYKRLNLPFPVEIEEEIIYYEKTPFIKPVIDGKITNFYEWYQAIEINPENLWATFKPFNLPIKKIYYGYDEESLYFRFDFYEDIDQLIIFLNEEIYEIEGKNFKDENIEWKWDEILEIKIKREKEMESSKVQFQIKKGNYDFILPPYSKISIIFKEPEWMV
jgi:alpha-amylase/alpha-mannosidase (GH57 family)